MKIEKYIKQISVPFKIYADFQCNLRAVQSCEASYTKKKHQDLIPCSFTCKVDCVDARFTNRIVVYKGEKAAYEFVKAIIKEHKYCRKVMNKHFNKTNCWICKKLIDNDEEKVTDHCHVTGKFRGAAPWN